jgi:serine protease Do
MALAAIVVTSLPAAGPPDARAHEARAQQQDRPTQATGAADESTALAALQQGVYAAIERAAPSVVAIARVRKGSPANPSDPNFVPAEFASGVVISADGLILTNFHALGDPSQNDYVVWVAGRAHQAVEIRPVEKWKGADPWTDLAVLKIAATDLQPITFGDGAAVRRGQFVVALGNPYALARDGRPSVAWGIVSNLQRPAEQTATASPAADGDAPSLHHYGTLIQTDARIQLGASGGAIINLDGEMIGLTTALAALQPYDQGAGLAIPVDDVFRRVVDALADGRAPEFGFLGVSPRNLSAEQRRHKRTGVQVGDVVEGTPARAAGLEFGDIITRIDDQPIDSASDLMRLVGGRAPEDEITVTFLRDAFGDRPGRERQTTVRLSKKAMPLDRRPIVESRAPQWRGLTVDYATAMVGFEAHSREIDPRGCVAIVDVQLGSPAWQAGLRPQTFISHVQRRLVRTPEEFFARVGSLTGDVELTLTAEPGLRPTAVVVRDDAE